MRKLALTIILVLFAGIPARENVDDLEKKLERIQSEISGLEKELKSTQAQLKQEVATLSNIDKQITLTNEKIRTYNTGIDEKGRIVKKLEIQISSLKNKLEHLKEIFKKQILFAYKYYRGKHLDWLLGASNTTDILVKHRYFQKISAAEKTTFEEMKAIQLTLVEQEENLKREINSLALLKEEASVEEVKLKDRRLAKSKVVNRIKQNRTLTQQALQDKRESMDRLLNLIASLNKDKSARQLAPQAQMKWENLTGSFSKNKGNLNWPVRGELMHKFGRYRNPQLKTTLNNTGIDIKAQRGSNVYCVFPGIVSLITYMSGFGNMIIIDHNDGYYTVYTHLNEIFLNQGEFIEGGSVIGVVGETGSLEGAKLHFEIYANNQPINPIDWLKKSL